ncbi:hypothetical protein [Brevibacillus sp. SYSU BS000544]|uniref:hypothetical protein n=1 Tax=Brevibacillus sp. SYSU BS000544 TaxID=3416443 RepID=UPI003CE47931
MIEEKYRERLPPYWYENKVAEYYFEGSGQEVFQQSEVIQDLSKQMVLPFATYSLDTWDWIFFGDTQMGNQQERRKGIQNKNLAKSSFSMETLRQMGVIAGKLDKVTENFVTREIMFEFSDIMPVYLIDLERDFERIRPVHVQGSQALIKSSGGAVIVNAYVRSFEVDYPICGTFYPEDGLEGRIYRESIALKSAARTHNVNYPLTNEFYSMVE